jgi:hypothetical protein
MKKQLKRVWRIVSFTLGTGLLGIGAGSVWGLGAVESAGLGATLALLGLTAALLLTHAAKGVVTDQDFDTAINAAIETVKSGTKDKKDL